MEQLREIARFLDEEVQKFSRKAYSDLKSDAPRTTPDFSSFEVWFGRSRYKVVVTNVLMPDGKMTHVDFLEAIISTYVKDRTAVQLQGYQMREDNELAKLSWDNLGAVRGEQSPGMDVIWMQFLPMHVAESLGEAIASRFDSQVAGALRSFPADYSRRNYLWSGNADMADFRSTFAHELTHFYATANTKLGDLQRKGSGYYEKNIVEVSGDEFAEYLSNMEHRNEMQRHAKEIGSDDNVSAVEEIFAHFIGFQYRENSGVDPSYDRHQYIQWGLDILYEKASVENPMSPVDWAREEMKNVFNDIAQRGMLKSNGDKQDILVIFLKRMMPQADRKRMNYMRQIAEQDLSKAYSDLHEAVMDAEKVERSAGDREAFNDFREFEQQVDWENPREIEDVVLHQVLEEAVGNLSLSETEELLKKKLRKEVENLETLIENAKTLEQELVDGEADQKIVNAVRRLSQAEQEIQQLT